MRFKFRRRFELCGFADSRFSSTRFRTLDGIALDRHGGATQVKRTK